MKLYTIGDDPEVVSLARDKYYDPNTTIVKFKATDSKFAWWGFIDTNTEKAIVYAEVTVHVYDKEEYKLL